MLKSKELEIDFFKNPTASDKKKSSRSLKRLFIFLLVSLASISVLEGKLTHDMKKLAYDQLMAAHIQPSEIQPMIHDYLEKCRTCFFEKENTQMLVFYGQAIPEILANMEKTVEKDKKSLLLSPKNQELRKKYQEDYDNYQSAQANYLFRENEIENWFRQAYPLPDLNT